MSVALARGSYKRMKNQETSDESREASYNLKVRKRRNGGGGKWGRGIMYEQAELSTKHEDCGRLGSWLI